MRRAGGGGTHGVRRRIGIPVLSAVGQQLKKDKKNKQN